MYISSLCSIRAWLGLLTAGLFLIIIPGASADSTQRNPLRYISRLDDPVIHTPLHRVHALASFEISFVLHSRRQKVRLSLEPNHDIIPDGAAIQHVNADGSVALSEPINRLDHRIFRGSAFVQHPGHSEWTNAGWARIYVHQDGREPVFEGAFRLDGDHHHIQSSRNYLQTRLAEDPLIASEPREYMVVWRDSDIVTDWEDLSGDDGEEIGDELRRRLRRAAEAGPPLLRDTSCTSDGLAFNSDDMHPVYRGLDTDAGVSSAPISSLFGRQIDGTTGGNSAGVNLASTIGNPAGCPSARKVALVGIATDCTYTAQFASKANVTANVIQQINSASQVYESTFNISLGIQNLTIESETCPSNAASAASLTPWNTDCSSGLTITDRLNLFSKWRGTFNDTNAYWMLLSTCNTESAVGLAWLGQLCVPGSQTSTAGGSNETVAAANVVVRTSTEWQVMAHETGHTFGAVHDCTSQTCSDGTVTKQQCCPLSSSTCDAGGQYIMNPSTGNGITQFSPCSLGNICSALGRNSVKSSCLTNNKDVTVITGSQCGNGIVETGEDCDCGGEQGCGNDPCCDPKTCKFTAGSLCDPANEECCTSTCQFASNGTVCRASTGSCDPAETCTGSTAVCPDNVSAPDGTVCGDPTAGLACASGQCTSRDLQCKALMGSLTTGNDTYACNSQGCQLSCASPQFGANTCFTMMQNFLDGTPCQGGGHCNNGNCEDASVAQEISSWVSQNKNIVIPVACVVGALFLIALVSCCYSIYRRLRRRRSGYPGMAAAAAAAAAAGGRRGRPRGMPKPPGGGPYGGSGPLPVPPPPPPGWGSAYDMGRSRGAVSQPDMMMPMQPLAPLAPIARVPVGGGGRGGNKGPPPPYSERPVEGMQGQQGQPWVPPSMRTGSVRYA